MKKSSSETLIYITKIFVLTFLLLINFSCRKAENERKAFSKVTTLAGTGEKFGEPFGVATREGEIFVSDGEHGKIWRVSKDGAISVLTDKLNTPSHIAFDKNGDLIVADSGAHQIKRVRITGEIEIVAGKENQAGFADGEAQNALFYAPIGVAVSGDKIYVADTYNDKIRVIENGRVSTLAGSVQGFADSMDGQTAKFDTPCGIAVKNGKIIVADAGNRRLRVVEENGGTSTLAGNGGQDLVDGNLSEASFVLPLSVAVGKFGEIYVADGNSIRVIGRRFFPLVETISNTRRGFSDGVLLGARFNRPSGLALDETGNLFVADAENQALRVFSGEAIGKEISSQEIENLTVSAEEFRKLGEPRWTYQPPDRTREIAGTLGEVRGDVSEDEEVWFHNGLDIVGGYGETARFIRAEKVLRPFAVANFGNLRESVRMPTLAYVHIRLGRDKDDKIFDDKRFLFSKDNPNQSSGNVTTGKINNLRIPRGSRFKAGEAIGTLNAMNHVHLIAGRSGAEMNALDALVLPGVSDKIAPVIEQISLFDQNWQPVIETQSKTARIRVGGKTRVVVRAYDRMDGNAERRRLGVYSLGYQILREDKTALTEEKTTISFEFMPDGDFVRLVYAPGSKSGATGETIFNYIVSNEVKGDFARESFFDADALPVGNYVLRVFAADYFGNRAVRDIEIIK